MLPREKKAKKNETFRANWAIVKDWTEEARYQAVNNVKLRRSFRAGQTIFPSCESDWPHFQSQSRTIGVGADSKFADLRSDPPATFFRPYLQQDDMWSVTYELKTLGSTASVIAAVRNEVATIDKMYR